VPVAAGVFRPFATAFEGTKLHFCVAPATGDRVNLLPLFFPRSEIIVEGLLASAPFTCSAIAVYPLVFDAVMRPDFPSAVVNSLPFIVSVVSPTRPADSQLKVPA
jgi:hypothetical protein